MASVIRRSLLLALSGVLGGCIAGRVVVVTFAPEQERLRPQQEHAAIECLNAVGRKMGMDVEGPRAGPGGNVVYLARFPGKEAISGFYVQLAYSTAENGERVRISFRSLSEQVDPALADAALAACRVELEREGILYDIHRS